MSSPDSSAKRPRTSPEAKVTDAAAAAAAAPAPIDCPPPAPKEDKAPPRLPYTVDKIDVDVEKFYKERKGKKLDELDRRLTKWMNELITKVVERAATLNPASFGYNVCSRLQDVIGDGSDNDTHYDVYMALRRNVPLTRKFPYYGDITVTARSPPVLGHDDLDGPSEITLEVETTGTVDGDKLALSVKDYKELSDCKVIGKGLYKVDSMFNVYKDAENYENFIVVRIRVPRQ